jgi:hypothetical protein
MMRHFTIGLVCALVLSARANAQGMISGAKAVANRAAVAANAHTTAEQNPNGPQAPATAAKTTPVAATPTATTKVTPITATTKPLAAPAATTKPVAAATTGKAATATTTALKPAAPGKATTTKLAPATAPAITSDTGARSISVTQRGIKGEVTLSREVFSYDAGGRRDPFVSLLRIGDLRPDLNDLCLMVVLYDPTGRNSIGIMRDVSAKDIQYQVRVGQTLGRMRVAQIEPRQVVFTVEEIGFSRQEPLALGCSSTARTQ